MISYSHQGGEASLPKNIAIKVARAQKDMTQKALAEAGGISRQTMNAIEDCAQWMLAGFLGIAGCNTDPDSHRK